MRVLLTSNKNRDVASNASNLALSFFKLEGKEKKNPLGFVYHLLVRFNEAETPE